MAASLLKRSGGRMNYLKLLKLMYYADREMLVRRGTLITYDSWCAMKLGPVLSNTYRLIKRAEDANVWTEHISTQGFDVELVADPGDDELCRAVNDILDEVYRKHGHKEPFDVAYETHNLGEYENPEDKGRRVVPIEYRKVLEVEGLPFENIDKIIANIESDNEMDRILARAV